MSKQAFSNFFTEMFVKSCKILRDRLLLGAVIDSAVAASRFLIASGLNIPSILNGTILKSMTDRQFGYDRIVIM